MHSLLNKSRLTTRNEETADNFINIHLMLILARSIFELYHLEKAVNYRTNLV